jgi:hypothetical protein
MPRLSKEERAELEARLAADDDDGDDDELEIEYEGRRVRGSYRRVSEVASAWGFKLRPDPEDTKTDEPKPKGEVVKGTRFAGRRVS